MVRALLSVSDKSGVVAFASGLVELGVEIVSTGGTLKVLQASGIPAVAVETLTHFPEMMDGRLKTLHPGVHGGLLAKRNNPTHLASAAAHQIGLIDMVVVNLYPFAATIQNPSTTWDEAIEQIDIGGPAMIRSAAKNMADVTVVVSPHSYDQVLAECQQYGNTTQATRRALAKAAFEHTAAYDAVIASYMAQDPLPDSMILPLTHRISLRYGENPHQPASFYQWGDTPTHLAAITQWSGKALSYNNYLDMNAAYQLVAEFDQPAAVIIKHTNPCGVGLGVTVHEAYQRAHDADPVSAFGSVVAINREVDEATADALAQTFVEVVVAPSFDEKALARLKKKSALRLVSMPAFAESFSPLTVRHVMGGLLVQHRDDDVMGSPQVVSRVEPTSLQWDDIRFGMQVAKHVKSNGIVIVKNGVTLGVGAGQMSRIESVRIALEKAGEAARGATLASDAFFPFRDSIDTAAAHGIVAVVHPGGSMRDQESIDAADAHGLAMVVTGVRHFLH